MKIYNAELFEHRRLVYNSGFYEELMETMDLLVTTHICHHNEFTIVDAERIHFSLSCAAR